jgi:tetratricopeptide (TPR) repeat protein
MAPDRYESTFSGALAILTELPGSLAELMGNLDEATLAYEHALRANSRSIPAMNAISCILRTQEHFHKAVEYLQSILKLDGNNGDVWGSLGRSSLVEGSFICSLTPRQRPLLFDDGRFTTSVFGISTSSVPSPRPKGE